MFRKSIITAFAAALLMISTNAVAETIYINEDYESYDAGTVVTLSPESVDEYYDSITYGSITYAIGRRPSGIAARSNASITDYGTDKKLTVNSDVYCTSARGIYFTFDESALIPTTDSLTDDEILELSFDVSATQAFTVTGCGNITTDMLTTTESVNTRVILDKYTDKQYVIVTDINGKLLSSTVSELSAQTFTGMSFFIGEGIIELDNIKVIKKTRNVSLITLDAALEGVDISIGGLSFSTDESGTAMVALPHGTYTASASKDGYEHTSGMNDCDEQTLTADTAAQNVTFTLTLQSYTALPTSITVDGGQVFINSATPASTPFTISVKDQHGMDMTPDQYSLEWTINPSGSTTPNPDVTIDNGIVSVKKSYRSANKVEAYDVTATVTVPDASCSASNVIYVTSCDVVYHESVTWAQSGGTSNRNDELAFGNAISLSDTTNLTMDICFTNGTDGHRTVALVSDTGVLCGLQLTSDGTIKAWTGWTGNKSMNQYTDIDNFTESGILAENYINGTVLDICFSIDKEKQLITVSCNDVSVVLPYTLTADSITGLRTGQYRTSGAFTINAVTAQDPSLIPEDSGLTNVTCSKNDSKLSIKLESACEGILIVASYNTDGHLTDTVFINTTGTDTDYETDTNGEKLSVMLWNGISDMLPLSYVFKE